MEDVIPDGEVKLDLTCTGSSSHYANQLLRQRKNTTPAIPDHVWKSNAEPDLDFGFEILQQNDQDTQTTTTKMPPLLSSLTLRTLRTIVQRPSILPKPTTTAPSQFQFQPILRTPAALTAAATKAAATGPSTLLRRQFHTSPIRQATYNQVRQGCRVAQRARRSRSPALVDRSQMKGVCLKTGITKPKKPNSGERKTARVRLSSGKVVTAYIPGEGHNVQQHSVVLVRGGRAQDCPGVKYHLVRGAMDLGGVATRLTARSKYGSKKPKKD